MPFWHPPELFSALGVQLFITSTQIEEPERPTPNSPVQSLKVLNLIAQSLEEQFFEVPYRLCCDFEISPDPGRGNGELPRIRRGAAPEARSRHPPRVRCAMRRQQHCSCQKPPPGRVCLRPTFLIWVTVILHGPPRAHEHESPLRSPRRACLYTIPARADWSSASRRHSPPATVSPADISSALGSLAPSDAASLMDKQPEFTTPVWTTSQPVDEERVEEGRALMTNGRAGRAERHFASSGDGRRNLERRVDFGKNLGNRPVVQSLATLACLAPRRNDISAGSSWLR